MPREPARRAARRAAVLPWTLEDDVRCPGSSDGRPRDDPPMEQTGLYRELFLVTSVSGQIPPV